MLCNKSENKAAEIQQKSFSYYTYFLYNSINEKLAKSFHSLRKLHEVSMKIVGLRNTFKSSSDTYKNI